MSAIIADVGYCRCFCYYSPLSVLSMVSVLLSELDAAGHTDTLEILLLLSSDAIAADIELVQRPIVGGGVS